MSEKEQNRIFANNLKHWLLIRGVSQNDLADAVGVTKGAVSQWTSGATMPRVSKIQVIADYLHIGKSDLLEDKEQNDKRLPSDELRDRVFERYPALFYAVDKLNEEQGKQAENYIFNLLMNNDEKSD